MLFDNYYNGISDILNKNEIQKTSSLSSSNKLPAYFAKSQLSESLELQRANSDNKVLIEFDEGQLEALFGQNPFSFQQKMIGTHPDFENVKYYEYENHFCVTMFMDIKGSTRLNEKYSLLEIRKIKDTILTLAIHVTTHFGGHVHRLQGDGIFIQFVRKGQREQDAVINALNTASILTHFVSNDLESVFSANGIKPLRIRTGIDLGFHDDVIWSHYGIPGCSELTTTSLHTDLTAKLQMEAPSNGIFIGENARNILDIKPEFCPDIKDTEGKIDYYIYRGKINYRKFSFEWKKFLSSFDFIEMNSISKKLEIVIPQYRIKCWITDKNDAEEKIYFQNSIAIPKGSKIKFTLFYDDLEYIKKSNETIEWKAWNSGKEAQDIGHESHSFNDFFNDKIYCETEAAYKGHHYVECIITHNHIGSHKIIFAMFVE